jgi:hypothetical protein
MLEEDTSWAVLVGGQLVDADACLESSVVRDRAWRLYLQLARINLEPSQPIRLRVAANVHDVDVPTHQ